MWIICIEQAGSGLVQIMLAPGSASFSNSRIQDRSIRFFLPVAFVVFFSQLVVLSDSENVNFTLVKNAELGSRQCYSFATSKMRQRNRASRTNKKIDKFLGPGARWSSHTKNSTGTVNSSITNNFVACKHGHVVAAVVCVRSSGKMQNRYLFVL